MTARYRGGGGRSSFCICQVNTRPARPPATLHLLTLLTLLTRTQDHIDEVYRDQEAWTEKSIMSTAGSGFFSSDRTILEYAKCVAG